MVSSSARGGVDDPVREPDGGSSSFRLDWSDEEVCLREE